MNKVYVGPDKEHYYTLLPDTTKYKNMQIVQIHIKVS